MKVRRITIERKEEETCEYCNRIWNFADFQINLYVDFNLNGKIFDTLVRCKCGKIVCLDLKYEHIWVLNFNGISKSSLIATFTKRSGA